MKIVPGAGRASQRFARKFAPTRRNVLAHFRESGSEPSKGSSGHATFHQLPDVEELWGALQQIQRERREDQARIEVLEEGRRQDKARLGVLEAVVAPVAVLNFATKIMSCMLVESRQRLSSRAKEKPPPNPVSNKYTTIDGRLRAEGIDPPWKDLASGTPGFPARVDRMVTVRNKEVHGPELEPDTGASDAPEPGALEYLDKQVEKLLVLITPELASLSKELETACLVVQGYKDKVRPVLSEAGWR